jgi:hypothetical protein
VPDEDRCALLEAAIRQHRQQIGEAYGIGSFRAQHAANMRLWEHVRSEFVTASTEHAEDAE